MIVNHNCIVFLWIIVFSLTTGRTLSWRRRRRVVTYDAPPHPNTLNNSIRVEQSMVLPRFKRSHPRPPRRVSCTLDGDYKLRQGTNTPVLPTSNQIPSFMNCTKDLCYHSMQPGKTICWQCHLLNVKPHLPVTELISSSNLDAIRCDDVSCPRPKADVAFDYVTSAGNATMSIPDHSGPFHCNSYYCSTQTKCWKCRLNTDSIQPKTITKLQLLTEASCCPLPRELLYAGVDKASFDSFPGLHDVSAHSASGWYQHFENDKLIISLAKSYLITDVELVTTKNGVHQCTDFHLSFSHDGTNWQKYKEYTIPKVFNCRKSENISKGERRTLLKPTISRFVKVTPLGKTNNQMAMEIYGCDSSIR